MTRIVLQIRVLDLTWEKEFPLPVKIGREQNCNLSLHQLFSDKFSALKNPLSMPQCPMRTHELEEVYTRILGKDGYNIIFAISSEHGLFSTFNQDLLYTDTSSHGTFILKRNGQEVTLRRGQSVHVEQGDVLALPARDPSVDKRVATITVQRIV